MTIKAIDPSEPDYYVNGATGHTQYEKPYELMTESEQKLYQDFLSHQKAANDYVKKIERLQYHRGGVIRGDSILQDAMQAGFMGRPSRMRWTRRRRGRRSSTGTRSGTTRTP